MSIDLTAITPEATAPLEAEKSLPLTRPGLFLLISLLGAIVVDSLIHGQPPGLGWTLAVGAVVATWVVAGRFLDIPMSRSSQILLFLALFFGVMFSVRSSIWLTLLNLAAIAGLLLLASQSYQTGGILRVSLSTIGAAAIVGGMNAIFGLFPFLIDDLPRIRLNLRSAPLGRVFLGVLLALPLLILFGILFSAADPVFADLLDDLFVWNLESLVERIFAIIFLTIFAIGLLRYALTQKLDDEEIDRWLPQRAFSLGIIESSTLLTLLNLLFLSFVLIQFAYLFGGLDTLERGSITYSEYARRGFFELMGVALLVLPLVLALDWLAKPLPTRNARWINGLQMILLLLTGVILVSALQRMRLYVGEFGLTELRFYTSATMFWTGSCLAWCAATVLRERRELFAAGALLSALLLLALLNLMNPDGQITRYNTGRGDQVDRALDVEYLSQLSSDAVPALITYRDGLAAEERRRMDEALVEYRRRLAERLQDQNPLLGFHWGKSRALNLLETVIAADSK